MYHEIWCGWIGCALEIELCGDGFKPWLGQNHRLSFYQFYFWVRMWRGGRNLARGTTKGAENQIEWQLEGSRGVHQGSKEKLQFSSLSEGTRLGEFPWLFDIVFYSLLTGLWCMREWGLLFSWKSEWKIGFLGFFQKPPNGSRVTARRHTHQTQFLGINDEPPGGRGWTVRRHEHSFTIFWLFLMLLEYLWGGRDNCMFGYELWCWYTLPMWILRQDITFDVKLCN